MRIESPIASPCRWHLVSSRFCLRPSVHVDAHHLRGDANQLPAHQFRLRHPWQKGSERTHPKVRAGRLLFFGKFICFSVRKSNGILIPFAEKTGQ